MIVTRLGSLGVWVGVGAGDGDCAGMDGVCDAGTALGDGDAAVWVGGGTLGGVVSSGGATGGGAHPMSRRPAAAVTSTFLMPHESSGRACGGRVDGVVGVV